jgi:hypothetical protein
VSKRFIVGGEAKIDGSFDGRQETMAEIAVFILGLAPSTKVNANDSPSLRLHGITGPNHWLRVLYCQSAQSMTSISVPYYWQCGV